MAQTVLQTVIMEVEDCCNCGIPFAMPNYLRSRLLANGGSFYCPNGHSQHYTETEVQRLRKQLDQQTRTATQMLDRARVAELAEQETSKKIKRLEKRIKGGTCPCCKRTFSQLERHMHNKHPEFAKTKP